MGEHSRGTIIFRYGILKNSVPDPGTGNSEIPCTGKYRATAMFPHQKICPADPSNLYYVRNFRVFFLFTSHFRNHFVYHYSKIIIINFETIFTEKIKKFERSTTLSFHFVTSIQKKISLPDNNL